MVQLMGHRQTKGPVTVRQHLNYRATSRLHPFLLKCSKQKIISQERENETGRVPGSVFLPATFLLNTFARRWNTIYRKS